MDIALAILIGLGLAASCGFRVFVPLLVLSIAAKAGHIGLAPSLAWIASTGAMVAFATATAAEIAAYKIPWLDHALDLLASPAAVVAGAIVAASQIGTVMPSGSGGHMFGWSAVAIAGGGVAGLVQTATVGTRAMSTAATAGLANPLINVGQSVVSLSMSVLAIAAPAFIIVVLLVIGLIGWRWAVRPRVDSRRAVPNACPR